MPKHVCSPPSGRPQHMPYRRNLSHYGLFFSLFKFNCLNASIIQLISYNSCNNCNTQLNNYIELTDKCLPLYRPSSGLPYFEGTLTALYSRKTDIPQGAGSHVLRCFGAAVKRMLCQKCDAWPREPASSTRVLRGEKKESQAFASRSQKKFVCSRNIRLYPWRKIRQL